MRVHKPQPEAALEMLQDFVLEELRKAMTPFHQVTWNMAEMTVLQNLAGLHVSG